MAYCYIVLQCMQGYKHTANTEWWPCRTGKRMHHDKLCVCMCVRQYYVTIFRRLTFSVPQEPCNVVEPHDPSTNSKSQDQYSDLKRI